MVRLLVRGGRVPAAIVRILSSERFFYLVLAVFAVQALWLAFTALYPMAFDESYHFGLIQLHAQQWLPFFAHQPPNIGGDYGAVTRDPSYLYHYVMSLPYQLIRLVTSVFMAQVITLRVLNVALFVLNFILFRRLLFRLGASRPLAHTILFVFSLIPVVPLLAAHINYDNLFITLVVAALLLTFILIDNLRQHRLPAAPALGWISILLAGSIVKYPYLPIAAALGSAILWQVWKQRHYARDLRDSFLETFRGMRRIAQVGLVLLTIILSALVTERYAVNLWQYHTPAPDCSAVLDVESCLSYGPWARNYYYSHNLPAGFTPNKLHYPIDWIEGMWRRSFFTINNDFIERSPLPVPSIGTAVIGIIGVALLILFARRILGGNTYRQITLLALALYTVSLFVQTFAGYVQTGQLVAINGRYLVPFMPVMLLFIGMAFALALKQRPKLKSLAVVLVVLLMLEGGGAMTFILRSEPSWDWQSPLIINANNAARNILSPLIVGSRGSDS